MHGERFSGRQRGERAGLPGGLAIGDFDNDGTVDVFVSINNGAPLLLKNTAGAGNHWLGLQLIGEKSNPDAVGARISYQAGDLKRGRMKVGSGSTSLPTIPGSSLAWANTKNSIGWKLSGHFRAARLKQYTNLSIACSMTIVEADNKWTQSNAEPEGISSRASGSHLTEVNESSESERGSLVDRTGFWTNARAKSLSSSRVCPVSPELHRVAVI